MLVATLRPAELIASGHPLKAVQRELLARQLCEELPLDYLSEAAVAEHLAARFPGEPVPAELAGPDPRTHGRQSAVHGQHGRPPGGGTADPAAPDGWRMDAAIDTVKMGVPDSIRHVIETQIERLDDRDQRMLEAASVAGAEFSVAALSAALDDPVEDVEVRCEALCRRHQFIRDCGVHILPNGDTAGRYGFVHAFIATCCTNASPRPAASSFTGASRSGARRYTASAPTRSPQSWPCTSRRPRITRRPRGTSSRRPRNAMLRSAYREAITLCSPRARTAGRGARHPRPHPPGAVAASHAWRPADCDGRLRGGERRQRVSNGRGALCDRLETTPEISQVLWGLWTFRALKGDLSSALGIATEFLVLAERVPIPRGGDARPLGDGDHLHPPWRVCAGARAFRPSAIASTRQSNCATMPFFDALNPGVALRCFAAWSLWFTGQPDRALRRIEEAVALAREAVRTPRARARARVRRGPPSASGEPALAEQQCRHGDRVVGGTWVGALPGDGQPRYGDGHASAGEAGRPSLKCARGSRPGRRPAHS